MKGRIVIEGNTIYEIDEECLRKKRKEEEEKKEKVRKAENEE